MKLKDKELPSYVGISPRTEWDVAYMSFSVKSYTMKDEKKKRYM